MTDETFSECLSILRVMPHGSEQAWTDGLAPLYALVLRPLDDRIGKMAVEYAVLNEQWRPAPARLREIAAIAASPIPDAEQAYAELMHKAQAIGLHGQPDPDNPNVFLTGPPPMSHPIVALIVGYCGGWEMFCTGESQMQEGLKKQVRGAHESVARQWRLEVSQQLALPPEQRNPVYFRLYAQYRLPHGFIPGVTETEERIPKALPSPELKDLPPEIRQRIRQTMKALPSMPKARMHRIPSEDRPERLSVPAIHRRSIEAEVKAKAEEAARKAEDPEYIRKRLEGAE